MKILIHVIAIVAIAIMSGCTSVYTSAVRYETLTPAKYTLPQFVEKVVVLNATEPTLKVDVTQLYLNGKPQSSVSHNYELTQRYTQTIVNELNKSGYITAEVDTLNYRSNWLTDNIASICEAHAAQAVISIDTLNVYIKSDISNSEGFYFVDYIITIKTSGTFHLADGSYKKFEPSFTGALNYKTDEYSTLQDCTKDINKQFNDDILNNAIIFAQDLVPTWEEVSREYYSGNNVSFIAAAEWVSKGNWDEAKNIWGNMYQNTKDINSARAALNIAISYEYNGDIENAAIWCAKAIDRSKLAKAKEFDKDEQSYFDNYFKLLLKRKNDIEILDKQMKK